MEFDAELAAAVRAGRTGDVTREIEHLTKCLALKLSGEQESLARSHLALAYARSDGEKARAEVKRALGLAKSDRARARALLSSATVELRLCGDELSEKVLSQVFSALTEATELYEKLGTIDFLSCLLTMAETARWADEVESAESLYRRVMKEVSSPKWAGAPIENRRGLEARACHGLAGCALLNDSAEDCRVLLERAVRLLDPNDPHDARMLREIAGTYEEWLEDPETANAVRAKAGAAPSRRGAS
jgi:hypothetical protein